MPPAACCCRSRRRRCIQAQQKMQFALRKNNTSNGKVADGGISTPKKCFLQNNRKLDREDSEVSSSNLRNSDQRCVIFTLVADELGACWRVLAPFIIPLRGTDQRNLLECGSHVKMDSLEPVSPSPVGLDMQKSQTNDHLQDHTGHNDFIGTGSADLVKGISKVDKPMKKSSRKKSKKKRRKQKKAFRNCETAIASDQGIHGVSALDTCSNSGSALGDVCSLDNDLSENATPFSVSSQEIITGNFYDEENSNDTINLSATSSKATSSSDDVELLERAASLPHDSASDDFGSNQLGVNDVTTNTMQTREVTLSDFNAVLLDAHLKLNATLPVTSSGSSSEEQSAPVLDSFYDGWNSDGCKPLIRKENRAHPFDSGTIYDSNNGIANNDSTWSKAVGRTDSDGTRYGQGDASSSSSDGFTVISRKKGKQKRNSLMSSNEKHRVSNDVDVHRRSGKGSNYSLCQQAQKIAEDKCFYIPKNIDPIGSRVDASNEGSFFAKPNSFVDLTKKMHEKSIRSACLHEITAQGDMHRRSARTDVNASSLKSEYGNWKNKLLERLKREPGSELKQESIHNSRNDCHTGETTLVRPTKMKVPQKEVGIPLNVDPIGSRVHASNEGSFFAKPNTFVDLTKTMHEKSIRSACLHEITAQGDMHRRSARTDVNASSLKSEYGNWKNKLLERLKREPGSELKQESIHNSRNDCHTGETTLVRPTKMKVPQKEVGIPLNIDPIGSRVDASNEGSFFAKPNTFVDLTKKMHEKSIRSACLHEITAQGDMHRRSARTDVNASSLKSEYGNWKNKLLERLKREPGSELKQESIHNSRNDCHTSETTLVRPTKMKVPQKEVGIPLTGNSCSRFGSDSTSSSCFRSDSVNSSSLEPLKYSEDCPEKTRLLGNVIPVGSDGIAQALHKPTGTLSAVSDSLVQLAVESDSSSNFSMDKPGDFCIHVCNENEPSEPETCVFKVENGKSDHDCGSILQNWIPVGRKDDETFYHFPASQLDDAFSHGWNLSSTGEKQLCSVPCTNAGVTGLGSSSDSINYTSSKDEVAAELGYHAPGIPKELSSVHIPSAYQPIQKSYEQDISVDETDLSCISQAVKDAYRVQIESEGIQLATGFPLAEFEKLLLSAAPVLDQTCGIQHCNTCFGDHLVGDFLCRHQIPNVTLGSLWQWYEMIGSYGLEVKVEDCYDSKSKRFGGEFDAYFVPFLSAVQLFGHASSSINARNVAPNTSFANKNNVDATLEYSSHFGSHHVFSVPLRQSHKEEESDLSLPMNLLNISDSSSPSGQYEVCKQSFSSTCLSDPELLFEYFESEPPRQRRPLFDKIQELIRGNASSKSQIFGESWKLMRLHLHDLHPSSWYSVAWYPIYRIPAGKFGAAFLTYHSLGHFVHRSGSSDSIGGGASIVSPVVGLQSYNAQGECWFRPKNSMMFQMEGSLYSNPSKVLKERVRTLEQTADVMARASFLKGNRKFVNRQPDYEFFLSRRR